MTPHPRYRLALTLLLPLFPALLACFQIANLDIGFHIATGRAVLMLGSVPKTNVLSFATPDAPWILHQWLPALLFSQLHDRFGPEAMILAKCLVIYGVFLLLWLTLVSRASHWSWALLWLVIAVGAASYRFFVRPFIFSMLALTAVLYLLTRYHDQRQRWQLGLIAGIVGLASACHSGVLYSLLVLGAWLAATLAVALLDRGAEQRREFWRALATFGAALGLVIIVVSLTSPWGAKTLLLPFTFSGDSFLRDHINEMRPLPCSTLYAFSWTLLLAAGPLLALFVARNRVALRNPNDRRLLLFELAILLGFAVLAVKHRRLVFVHALSSATCLARWSGAISLKPISRRLATLLTGLAVVAALLAGAQQFTQYRFGLGVDQRSDPKQLLTFVATQQIPMRAFVSDGWGGRWLWAFYPAHRVFYDNRIEAYPPHFLRDVYTRIRYANPGWQQLLARYRIDSLVLKYSSYAERRFQRGQPNLRDRVFKDRAWQLVYWDDKGMIYVRRDKVPASCTRCGDFRLFNPDTRLSVPTSADNLLLELNRAWTQMPSARACYALADILGKTGRRPAAQAILRDGLKRFPDDPELEKLALKLARRR